MINNGKANFTDKFAQLLPQPTALGKGTKATFQDLNGDNKPELISARDGEKSAPTRAATSWRQMPELKKKCPDYAVQALAVADFDSDGKLDIMLGRNQYKVRVRLGRNETNLAQIFLDKSISEFIYLPQQRSGLFVMEDVSSLSVLNKGSESEILIARNGLSLKTLQIAKKR